MLQRLAKWMQHGQPRQLIQNLPTLAGVRPQGALTATPTQRMDEPQSRLLSLPSRISRGVAGGSGGTPDFLSHVPFPQPGAGKQGGNLEASTGFVVKNLHAPPPPPFFPLYFL